MSPKKYLCDSPFVAPERKYVKGIRTTKARKYFVGETRLIVLFLNELITKKMIEGIVPQANKSVAANWEEIKLKGTKNIGVKKVVIKRTAKTALDNISSVWYIF